MSLPAIHSIQGRALPIPGADIDTDRIIPARFLKCVTFDDLAAGLFYDERFDADKQSKNHPLDDPRYRGATILIVGSNFGCGSSREHAPQSIYRAGFRAIIGESFAEIFFGNSTGLGMPCVNVTPEIRQTLSQLVADHPQTELTIDLASQNLTAGNQSFPLSMPEGARQALTSARWDTIGELLDHSPEIDQVAARLGYA